MTLFAYSWGWFIPSLTCMLLKKWATKQKAQHTQKSLLTGLQCDFTARKDNMSSEAGRGNQWQTDWALCLSGSCAERSQSGKNLSDSQLTWPKFPLLSHSCRPALWLLEAFRGLVKEADKRIWWRNTLLLSNGRLPSLQLFEILVMKTHTVSYLIWQYYRLASRWN